MQKDGINNDHQKMNQAKAIREFIITNFLFGDGTTLRDDTSFLDSGIIDSTGILELIMFVEGEYRIKVAPEDAVPENLDSVNRVARYVEQKLAAKRTNSMPMANPVSPASPA